MNNDDPFAWRNQGGRFEIGTDEDSGTTAFIEVEKKLLILTDKNIYQLYLPDAIDPKRTNPNIPASKQKIVSYGSDDHIVGRTLQQASVLFEEHSLPDSVNHKKALSIAMSFLKEMVTLQEAKEIYEKEEADIRESFNGKLQEDNSFQLPSISDIEQRLKRFINNAGHSQRHLIEITKLFYPETPDKLWNVKLQEKLLETFDNKEPIIQFLESTKNWIRLIRELRNEIEHPSDVKKIEINNYRLKETGTVSSPTIKFDHKNVPLNEIRVSKFMSDTVESSLLCFELLMAYLCNIHAQTFADDERVVIEVPNDKREKRMVHVRFAYQILWTK